VLIESQNSRVITAVMKIANMLCSDGADIPSTDSTDSMSSTTAYGLRALALAASLVDTRSAVQISEGGSVKPKRKRASATQVAVLRAFYGKNPFPDTQCREFLAEKLNMTPRSVQIWFQNQRQHDKMSGQKKSAPWQKAHDSLSCTIEIAAFNKFRAVCWGCDH